MTVVRPAKVAVITGSSGGIGVALCCGFAEAGYEVLGLDCAPSEHDAHEHITVDLARLCADPRYQTSVVQDVRSRLPSGELNVLVNNAAVQVVKPAEELTAEDWHRTLDTNVVAAFFLTQTLLPELERGAGSVVNIASVHASLTKPGFVCYATSKAALVGLTKSLAVDLGQRVRINAICPGAVATPMLIKGLGGEDSALHGLTRTHPLERIAQPQEISDVAVFLASNKASFMTGAIIEVDGGIGARLHDTV